MAIFQAAIQHCLALIAHPIFGPSLNRAYKGAQVAIGEAALLANRFLPQNPFPGAAAGTHGQGPLKTNIGFVLHIFLLFEMVTHEYDALRD